MITVGTLGKTLRKHTKIQTEGTSGKHYKNTQENRQKES